MAEAASELSQSEGLMRIMREWKTNIFEKLLLPMRIYSQIADSVKSSSSSRKSKLCRDSDVKDIILARDGMISPVGRAIDKSAQRHIRQSAPERVVRLQAAHIMPFKLAKYSAMQALLSMFAGTSVEAILRDGGIISPNLFIIGVEYLNGQYRLRKIVPEDADEGPFMSHCSIARVLHASGAGEVINNILEDGEKYNDGIVEDEASAARISAFAVKMALGNAGCGNKQQECGKGILRVSTNSQVDGQ
ncbi:hypothetical protein V1517DRAFT_369788 [Lipomyces orientalis]|uniref:Uncharacterized protein n=1 Tax=Lipomyces orientalis TaxID=1233043 RepID=A0ACC3TH76_9ASCO